MWMRLACQDLFDEVVDDEPVVAGEVGEELADVGSVPQRQGRQLQCGGPALGAAPRERARSEGSGWSPAPCR